MVKELKRASGKGSVYKLTGRRSKPYAAAVTTSCSYSREEGKYIQKRVYIGYYSTRDAAVSALTSYIESPYDLEWRKITFDDLYRKWSESHFKTVSASYIRTLKCAYKYFEPLYDMKFCEIRPVHIEGCIENAEVHSNMKRRMKSLCNMLYRYAVKSGVIETNYSELCDDIKSDPPVIARIPFTPEEVERLWDSIADPYVVIIITALYSGWRPGEILMLKLKDVDIGKMTMRGGLKTRAGKNRIVPVHYVVQELVKRAYQNSKKSGSEFLFSINGEGISYNLYHHHFMEIMTHISAKHTPHDTRHTFITYAKASGFNEYILKLIVGHAITDITENVYTHRTISELKNEMNKYEI